MAEYYTVLKKAIGGLESNQAEARRTVYGEARIALIDRLRAADPSLNAAEISRRRRELEEDIRKVERDLGGAIPVRIRAPARPVAPPRALDLVPKAPVPTPASESAEEESPPPEDIFRRAIQEAMRCGTMTGVAAGAIERVAVPTRAKVDQDGRVRAADLRPPDERATDRASPPVPNSVRVAPVPTPTSDVAEEGSPSLEDTFSRAIEEATICDTAAGASVREHTAVPWPGEVNRQGGATADLRPSGERVIDHALLPVPREGEETPVDVPGAEALAIDRQDNSSLPLRREPIYLEEDDLKAQARPSRLPLLVTAVVIAVILGGGALAWSKRVMIGQIIATPDSSNAASTKPKLPPIPNSGQPAKNTDRLIDPDSAPSKATPGIPRDQ